ncbi:MAG: LytTR family DNA-binding domain-containing protein [Ruminococcus sp.]|nr:LytTR family DNA-binding domain-containing protein [Ruminococcus sp.]
MIKIAVCDDEYLSIDRNVKYIKEYECEKNIPISIDKYQSGNELLNSKKSYDLIFLDVEMEDLNGIDTAEKIRLRDTRVQIVYVTGFSKYSRPAYKVHAFDFLEKPCEASEIFRVLTDYITYNRENEAANVYFKVADGIKAENMNNIYYCVFLERKTVFVSTVFGNYDVCENLNDVYDKLDHSRFYMPFKDTVINLKYVVGYKSTEKFGILMSDGKKFQIAKRKQKEFYNILARELRKFNHKNGDDKDEL